VVAGAILGPDGCGGASSLHPSLWWSSDGAAWSRQRIEGASSANDAWMSVVRLSQDAVVAIGSSSDMGLRAWVSHDGRTWVRASTPPTQLDWGSVGDGRRTVIVADPESGSGPPTILAIDDDLSVTTLAQTGTGPMADEDSLGWSSAVGPTGILVVSDNGRELWLGIPS
jgi:hypothetical protein